jgi:hypothetical protein
MEIFELLIHGALFLRKQEFVLRAHNENLSSINPGNFKELVTLKKFIRNPKELF